MTVSLFLAKFLGLYMLIMATLWLTRKKQVEAAIKNIMSSSGVFALTGAIHVIAGLMILISHPVWELNWRGLITILGFLTLIQGIIRLAFPERSKDFLLKSIKQNHSIWISFLIVVGAILTYFGFISV